MRARALVGEISLTVCRVLWMPLRLRCWKNVRKRKTRNREKQEEEEDPRIKQELKKTFDEDLRVCKAVCATFLA